MKIGQGWDDYKDKTRNGRIIKIGQGMGGL